MTEQKVSLGSKKIVDHISKALDDQIVEDAKKERRRGYLGMSSIGGKCERKEFYNFRWVDVPVHSPRLLRKFKDGHEAEPRAFERLRACGATIWDGADGGQFECVAKGFGGHFRGHLDAVAKNLPLPNIDPKEPVLVDIKVCEKDAFQKLVALINVKHPNPLKEWKLEYYGQAQMYMKSKDLRKACYVVFTPGLLDCISVTADRDFDYIAGLEERAKRIVFFNGNLESLGRVSEVEEGCQDCFFCSYNDVCYKRKMPDVNCRTCIHASPMSEGENGDWYCSFKKKKLDNFDNCGKHIYNPCFFDGWASVADIAEDYSWVVYNNAVNNKRFINSNEEKSKISMSSENIRESYAIDGPKYIEEN